MQNRENVLHRWIKSILGQTPYQLKPLAGDASFRRYYRLEYQNISRIIMDAPPDKESIEPFIRIGNILKHNDLFSPNIHAINLDEGFLLLDDFGDLLFSQAIKMKPADSYYRTALSTLLMLQKCSTEDPLPHFDIPFMLKEMSLFQEWFLEAYLHLDLSADEKQMLAESQTYLATMLSQQPQVFIHRDYHSRNLMILEDTQPPKLGIIDFQDAMIGPITYDLASILKDCYIAWPREQIITWVSDFYFDNPLVDDYSPENFVKAFDLCGLQRHLKVLGIFTRLHLRDNKPAYLQDLPLTLDYVLKCTATYEELHPLHKFLNKRVQLP